MQNLNQNPENEGINAVVLKVSSATPLYLFLACIGSFLILLVIQIVHDIDFWTAKMPTIGIFLGIAGALFVQVVRFGGLIGSTYNFARRKLFAGVLCIALSIATSLWEHTHVPGMAAYFLTAENAFLAKEQFVSFMQVLIWIGLGLEILIVASTYGKHHPTTPPETEEWFRSEMANLQSQIQSTNETLSKSRQEALEAFKHLENQIPMELNPSMNGNGASH